MPAFAAKPHARRSHQRASRGALQPDWSQPAYRDERGQLHALAAPPRVVDEVLFVDVRPVEAAAEAEPLPAPPLIQAAVPLVELRLVAFDELPPDLADALRQLNAQVIEVFEVER